MTGTPIQNRMMDYYSILDWVTHRNMFPFGKKDFEEKYSKPIEAAREKGEKTSKQFQASIKKSYKVLKWVIK